MRRVVLSFWISLDGYSCDEGTAPACVQDLSKRHAGTRLLAQLNLPEACQCRRGRRAPACEKA